jgi:hypothetical protein
MVLLTLLPPPAPPAPLAIIPVRYPFSSPLKMSHLPTGTSLLTSLFPTSPPFTDSDPSPPKWL